jgi:Protein of unknown function (DUF3300)
MRRFQEALSIFLTSCLVLTTVPGGFAFQAPPPPAPMPVQGAQATPEQLQELVAPIALYPDSLVAQILAASIYPDQIVEADRWLQDHKKLKGDALAQAVDPQPWDPSVKALTAFPSVLANMDKNLSWTSSLGQAYVNQQADVMNAVQVMRQRAQAAGNLKSTPQERVYNNGPNIVIDPVAPNVVYLPEYDPWLVYGAPLLPWPGWYWYPGLYLTVPGIAFGVGFGIGFFGGFGWGWGHWGFDWGHRTLLFNHAGYISHGNTFFNRNAFLRSGARLNNRSEMFRGGGAFRGNEAAPRAGAFSGFNRGAVERGFSERGFSSFGGARGGFGGGFHGGGGRR